MGWKFADQGVGGDINIGETPERLVERQHTNDSYGQDSQFDDHPVAEYKFFYANGELDVSGAHDLDQLRDRNNVTPDHGGPMAVGNLIVQDGTAIWEVTTNVGVNALAKTLRKYCVPLDTQILTQHGWLTYEDVKVGDFTLGYNPVTARNEWTEILDVHYFNEMEMGSFGSQYWKARVTPNHQWVARRRSKYIDPQGVLHRYRKDLMIETLEVGNEDRILTAAPFMNSNPAPVTPEEAALIGWLYSDGCLSRTQGHRLVKEYIDANIYQKKPEGIAVLDELMTKIPLTKRSSRIKGGFYYHINSEYIRELLYRSKLWDNPNGLVKFVLGLSPLALEEFMFAVYMAEGTLNLEGFNFSQNIGPKLDAFVLGAYLLGTSPSVGFNGTKDGRNRQVYLRQKRAVETVGRSLTYTPEGSEPAWCVTTGLGSWTMRQGNQILLTGNCKDAGWDWGGITNVQGEPLGGDEKLARKSYWLTLVGGKVQMSGHPLARGSVDHPTPDHEGRLDVVGRVAAYRPFTSERFPSGTAEMNAHIREGLEEFATDHNLRLAEYPGGGSATDYMKNHAPMGEDLELKNIPGEDPDQRSLERFHKDRDRSPEGIFKCPGCSRLFHRWHEYMVHRRTEEPQGEPVQDGHFPTIEESQSEMPTFTEARVSIKQPKDMFTEPVPFIYDIEQDAIFVGHPGARHGEIEAPEGTKFTPGGIVEGEYQPGGKVMVQSQSDTPYSVRHMLGLWYYQHPEFEVTGVMMTMPDGKQRKIAADSNIGAYVIGQAAQDPAVHAAWLALQKAGGVVYGVGGVVRDALLGKASKDVDLLVTGLPADKVDATLRKLPGRVDLTGKDFGVFRYNHEGNEVEVAMPRTERSTGERRVDFDVAVDHNLPIETDLQRRDFTANAIAVNLANGEVVDPYGGQEDIKNGHLKTVHSNSFPEDPTRLVRGLVAHARHGLHPTPQTRREMQAHAPSLDRESPDRIQAELDKLFSSDNPGDAIRLAHKTGMLKYLLPEVEEAWDFVQ